MLNKLHNIGIGKERSDGPVPPPLLGSYLGKPENEGFFFFKITLILWEERGNFEKF